MEQLAEELARADVAVACTSAPGFLIGPGDVRERKGRPLFLIDLAVPRDIDPAVNEIDGCYLYDIDDLEAVVEAKPLRPPARGGAGRDHRGGGSGAVPRLAGVARGRSDDRVAAGARGGDSLGGLSKAKLSDRERARRRVDHLADREQAPAPAHRADEGGGRGS